MLLAFAHVRREMGIDCRVQAGGGQDQGRALCHCTDCTAPAVLKVVQRCLLAAVAAELVAPQRKNHCTPFHGVLMEGTLLLQDACNSTERHHNYFTTHNFKILYRKHCSASCHSKIKPISLTVQIFFSNFFHFSILRTVRNRCSAA